MQLSWEPMGGTHFCIIFSSKVEIYSINKEKNLIKLVRSYTNKEFDHNSFTDAVWSPLGKYLVFADLKSDSGALAFINGYTGMVLEFVATGNYINSIGWDPQGMNLMTANLSDLSLTSDNMIVLQDSTVKIWCVSGRMICDRNSGVLGFCQWRPRPKLMITEKELQDLRQNLNTYQSEFMEEDKIKEQMESIEESNKMKSMLDNFMQWFEKINKKPQWRSEIKIE